MFDINSSILKLSIEDAKMEINKLIDLGYTGVILTFEVLVDGKFEMTEQLEKFNILKDSCENIKLYLGNEINYHYTIIHRIKNNDLLTLNKSNYVLIKLPKDKKPELFKAMINSLRDYRIILSNIDDYKYLSYKDLLEMKNCGILFTSRISHLKKGKVNKLLKNNLLDYAVTYDNICELPTKSQKLFTNDVKNKIFINNYKEIIN